LDKFDNTGLGGISLDPFIPDRERFLGFNKYVTYFISEVSRHSVDLSLAFFWLRQIALLSKEKNDFFVRRLIGERCLGAKGHQFDQFFEV
jgi:hypothetical protein